MKRSFRKQPLRHVRLLAILGVLAIAMSGCAINAGQLVTDVVEAALNSATGSIVDALSEQLARD